MNNASFICQVIRLEESEVNFCSLRVKLIQAYPVSIKRWRHSVNWLTQL